MIRMSKLYLVPDRKDMERMCGLAAAYGCAFEYNDFYMAKVMDDSAEQERIIADYRKYRGGCSEKGSVENGFCGDTMHGAFLDVTIHSDDPLIRDASMLRVRQSMELAKNMGLKGVVFHTGRLGGFRAAGYLRNWRDRNEAFFTEIAHQYPGQQIYMENMFDEAPDILAGLAEKMRDIKNSGFVWIMPTPCCQSVRDGSGLRRWRLISAIDTSMTTICKTICIWQWAQVNWTGRNLTG